MTRTRTRLGLCAVVFGLLAFSASAAQAETGAKWLVLKTEGGALLTDAEIEANKERFIGEIENKTASLLSKVLGIKIQILCTAGELIDYLLATNGSVKAFAKLKLSGCVALKAGTAEKLSGCFPHTAGQTEKSGIIETREVHALAELGATNGVILIIPSNEKEEFLRIEMGEECAVGGSLPLFGKMTLWDCEEEGKGASTHKVTHLVTEFKPLTKLYLISDTPEHLETTMDGSSNLKLLSGRSWAIKLN